MAKLAANTAQDADASIEYTIYTFDRPGGGKAADQWEKHGTDSDMQGALKLAEQLFASGKYQKVEVKQKYFDKKKNRNIDITLRVFESEPQKSINIFLIVGFAIFCGAAAFGLTYFLTR